MRVCVRAIDPLIYGEPIRPSDIVTLGNPDAEGEGDGAAPAGRLRRALSLSGRAWIIR